MQRNVTQCNAMHHGVARPQVQFSLLDRRPRVAMVDYCATNGIRLLPYGVVAGGFLSDK